jgi:sulfonate transport system permease protein
MSTDLQATAVAAALPEPQGKAAAQPAASAAAVRLQPAASAAAVRLRAAAARLARSATGLLLPAAILAAWWWITHAGLVKPYFLPTPEATLSALHRLVFEEELWEDFVASLRVVAKGYLLGSGLGLLLGVGAGLSRGLERLLGPTLDAMRQVPPLAWLPLVVLWVGIGDLAKTVVIAKVVFFPVFINTLQGIRGVAREHVEVARVFHLSRWRLATKVIIPGALPSILTGLRYGAGLSWSLVVVAEMLSGRAGLGYLIFRAQELLTTDALVVVMLIIGAVGFTLDRALRGVERRLLRWKEGYQG